MLLAAPYQGCDQQDTHSFTTPFIDLKAPEKSPNAHVPQITYEPLILIEVINPDTKQSLKCFGYLDTGADYCFIRREVADKIGLKADGQPAHEMLTGSGKLTLYSTTVKYSLGGTGEGVKGFPLQTASFFIHDAWLPADLVLGNVGFVDRFKEIRIEYPRSIALRW